MRLKYRTYDARRDEDIIHLETDQSNLMILNPSYSYTSSANPFKYCRVIAILHAEISYISDIGRLAGAANHYHLFPMEFLWVRWYEDVDDCDEVVGAADVGLDKVSLCPIERLNALDFLDPEQALRACHIIPDFSSGRKFAGGKGRSGLAQDGSDWKSYYVNRYVVFKLFLLRC